MAFYSPPIPVIDLVRRYDLTTNFDHPNGPLNLMLRDFTYVDPKDPTRLSSRLCPHSWYDSAFMLCQTQDKPKAPQFDDDIFLQTDSHTSNWIHKAQCVYFHQAEVIQWEPLTILVGEKRFSHHCWTVSEMDVIHNFGMLSSFPGVLEDGHMPRRTFKTKWRKIFSR